MVRHCAAWRGMTRAGRNRSASGLLEAGWPGRGLAQPLGELARRLVAGVEPGRLIAHDPSAGKLKHAPAHLVDHRLVMGGDEDSRPGPVDPVEEPHDVDARL